jgi:type II secretory pathway component PulJ
MQKIKNMIISQKFHAGKAGFTLVEMLLYMGLFSILLVITLQMFSSIFDVQLESEATSSVDVDAKYVMQRLSYDMNRASSITAPLSAGTSSATLTLVINNQNVTYSLSGTNLILTNSNTGTVDQLNSSDSTISNLSFVRLNGDNGKDTVNASFKMTSVAIRRGGKEVRNYTTSAGLR